MIKEIKTYFKDSKMFRFLFFTCFLFGTAVLCKGFCDAFIEDKLTFSMVAANTLLYLFLVLRMPVILMERNFSESKLDQK